MALIFFDKAWVSSLSAGIKSCNLYSSVDFMSSLIFNIKSRDSISISVFGLAGLASLAGLVDFTGFTGLAVAGLAVAGLAVAGLAVRNVGTTSLNDNDFASRFSLLVAEEEESTCLL